VSVDQIPVSEAPDAQVATQSPPAVPAPLERIEWHYIQNGQQIGPVSIAQLRQLASSGQLQPTDQVWKAGMPAWVAARSFYSIRPKQKKKSEKEESKLGTGSIAYVLLWPIGGGLVFGLLECSINPSAAIGTSMLGVAIGFAFWLLSLVSPKEKPEKSMTWRDKWEECPACLEPGGGQFVYVTPVDQRTVETTRTSVENVYTGDVFSQKKTGEIHRQVPLSYTVGTYLHYYQCKLCGHKWAKIAETTEFPPDYQQFLLEKTKQRLEVLTKERNKRIEESVNSMLNNS
jgi:hypothetical protein